MNRILRTSVLLLALAACGRASAEPGGTAAIPRGELRGLAGRIVFVSERDSQPEIYSVRPDGRGLRRLTSAASADYPAAPSPDGTVLLAVSASGEGQDASERMALLARDGTARSIGPVSARVRSPSWSPDGRWIAFESDTASFRDLYRIQSDGSGLRRLTDNPEGNYEPAVSPDGASIAFVSSRDGDAEVYVMRADGGEPRRLTAFHRDDWGPRWSPDGRRIAFLSNRERADRVFVVGADGTQLQRLDGTAPDSTMAEADPAWSPDGTRLALTVRTRDGRSRVAVHDLRTGRRTTVSAADEVASMPAWSPDGRHLVYVADRGGDPDLRIVRADGSAAATVVRSPGPDWLPRWVP
ncbi:MAG: tolB protein precursor protein [Gemmatimonadetes bacterium]|nr:tolB protein precursor protein [Gemmatimonadota bacterium]